MSDATKLALMCRGCAAAVPADNLFCGQCGAPVADPDSTSLLDTATQFARGTAIEAGNHVKEAMRSEGGQKIAGGAALGAAAGLMLPILTVGAGAVIGAGIIAYQRLLK